MTQMLVEASGIEPESKSRRRRNLHVCPFLIFGFAKHQVSETARP